MRAATTLVASAALTGVLAYENTARAEDIVASLPLKPTVLVEGDYRVFPSETEGNTGFALARMRPGLSLQPTSWFRALATVEFAGEYATILDAFMTLRATRWLEFNVGYARPPLFASSRYEPIHVQAFPDFAPVVSAFQVRRDIGVDVHMAPERIPIEAWLRVSNGTGSALGNDNALPAGYGTFDLVLGRAWTSAGRSADTYGMRVGVGAFVEEVRDRDGIIGATPLGFQYFRPVVVSGRRTVGEAHFVGYAGPLRLTIEGAFAREARSKDDDGNPNTPRVHLPAMRSYGITGELGWVVLGRPREVGLAPRGRNANSATWDGGAVELAARYDAMFLGRGASDVLQGGAQSAAFVAKWWPTDFLAASVSSYAMHYETPAIERPTVFWSWGMIARASFYWGLGGQRKGLL